MNIRPANTPGPGYPALATIALAAALTTPACQQVPQPTAGAPLPPPQAASSTNPPRNMQRTPGARATSLPGMQKREPQRTVGKMRRQER